MPSATAGACSAPNPPTAVISLNRVLNIERRCALQSFRILCCDFSPKPRVVVVDQEGHIRIRRVVSDLNRLPADALAEPVKEWLVATNSEQSRVTYIIYDKCVSHETRGDRSASTDRNPSESPL